MATHTHFVELQKKLKNCLYMGSDECRRLIHNVERVLAIFDHDLAIFRNDDHDDQISLNCLKSFDGDCIKLADTLHSCSSNKDLMERASFIFGVAFTDYFMHRKYGSNVDTIRLHLLHKWCIQDPLPDE